MRPVLGSHVRLPAPSTEEGQDRPLPMRLRPQERRRPGTAARAEPENLSGFRLTAGQKSSRAESALGAISQGGDVQRVLTECVN